MQQTLDKTEIGSNKNPADCNRIISSWYVFPLVLQGHPTTLLKTRYTWWQLKPLKKRKRNVNPKRSRPLFCLKQKHWQRELINWSRRNVSHFTSGRTRGIYCRFPGNHRFTRSTLSAEVWKTANTSDYMCCPLLVSKLAVTTANAVAIRRDSFHFHLAFILACMARGISVVFFNQTKPQPKIPFISVSSFV